LVSWLYLIKKIVLLAALGILEPASRCHLTDWLAMLLVFGHFNKKEKESLN